jgi:hypothetical protein
MIEVISNNAVTLQNKERDKSILNGLKQKLKEKEKAIANLVKAIEAGAFSPSIQSRLSNLEEEKADIEGEIAMEQIEKPFITADQVRFYLEHFRDGDLEDESYCRDIIDIFVRAVYIFDDKYYITYYYTNDPSRQAPPDGSDLKCFAPPIKNPETMRVSGFFLLSADCGENRCPVIFSVLQKRLASFGASKTKKCPPDHCGQKGVILSACFLVQAVFPVAGLNPTI